MPLIKLQHVVSVSSEDKNFQAENLLKNDGFKKWKSQKSGEKNVSVTLQFEKASKVHQIDLGNEGSAFIEVLVGKSATKDEEFKVLLVSSSFMNPIDSRNNQNLNKVRMFGPEQLNQTISNENWDRVKIICSQPFNKSIQYGISFVKFHAPPEPGEDEPPKTMSLLGGFKLKSDDSEDSIRPGSLFTKAKEKKEVPPLTGAAAVRAASKLSEESVSSDKRDTQSSVKRKLSERDESESKKPKPEQESSQKKKHVIPTKAAEKPSSQMPLQKQTSSHSSPGTLRKQTTTVSTSSHSSTGSVKKGELKRAKSESDKPKEKQFDQLMKKVVFVLSGFENPYRGQLRDKALEMGATYKPDWGKTCTHLICAFKNTPKYNQVNGKGCIVGKDWIKDCYKQKKKLPWRDYRLGKSKSPPPSSSESEEEDLIVSKKAAKVTSKTSTGNEHKTKPASKEDSGDDTDVYGGSTDEGDTDDEIQRIKASKKKEKSIEPEAGTSEPALDVAGTSKPALDVDDPYDAATDDEGSTVTNGDTLPELPNFFQAKKFFIYGKLPSSDRRVLKRYIVAYDGMLEEYMSDQVNYLLAVADWDDSFDQASVDNPSLIFVRPNWVHECHNQQKLLPFQKFIIVPK